MSKKKKPFKLGDYVTPAYGKPESGTKIGKVITKSSRVFPYGAFTSMTVRFFYPKDAYEAFSSRTYLLRRASEDELIIPLLSGKDEETTQSR